MKDSNSIKNNIIRDILILHINTSFDQNLTKANPP